MTEKVSEILLIDRLYLFHPKMILIWQDKHSTISVQLLTFADC